MIISSRARAALCLLLLALVWFSALSERKLVRPDEGRYAEIAREMAVSGDYVTPTLNGLKYFEKPPLQYWATAAAFNILGETPFAARLWPGLTGFLAVLATLFTVRRLATPQLAALATAIHASMLWVFGIAHVNTLDSGLTCWLHLCLCAFLLAYRPQVPAAQKRNYLVGAAAMAALAVLSKGLIGIVIPGAAIGFAILVTWRWSVVREFPWLRAALIFFVIAAPWFLWVSSRNAEFAEFFFIHEHFKRFSETGHARLGAPWYFVPMLVVGTLPWTGFAPLLLFKKWRNEITAAYPHAFGVFALLACWCVFIFVFFSVSRSKLPSYILPMFGPIAILLTPVIAKISPRSFSLALVPVLLVALAVVLGLTDARIAQFSDNGRRTAQILLLVRELYWVSASLGIGAAVAIWFAKREDRRAAVFVLSCAAILSYCFVMRGHNHLAASQSGDGLALSFIASEGRKALDDADTPPFFSVRTYDQTLPFYLRRKMILVDYRDEMNLGLLARPDRAINHLSEFEARWQSLSSGYAVFELEYFDDALQRRIAHRVAAKDLRRVIISRK